MNSAEYRNQAIIHAVLEREKALCPGCVALIGIYGSFLTGDTQPLSDLDLLILINDERGRQLGTAFILDDIGVGYDVYCTSWESLVRDAAYEHPHISKLMDSRIVYCSDEMSRARLEALRAQVQKKLAEPFGEEDWLKADREMKEAMCCYAKAMIAGNIADIRKEAGGVLYYAQNAVAMLNKTYFRKGVRRRFEELNSMEKRPAQFCERMESVLEASTAEGVREQLTSLMKALTDCFIKAKQSVRTEKKPACAESLRDTYEEMFSNWHGKMTLAAQTDDRHLAFMSLVSLNAMMEEIGGESAICPYDILSVYDPDDLAKTAKGFDEVLQDYLQEYRKSGLSIKRFRDVDAFVSDYLKSVGQN